MKEVKHFINGEYVGSASGKLFDNISPASGEKIGYVNPKGLPSAKDMVPKSFRIDRDDNIYILDIFSESVILLDPDGQFIKKIPLPARHGFFSDLAVDRQGKIYVLDSVKAVVHSAAICQVSMGMSSGTISA